MTDNTTDEARAKRPHVAGRATQPGSEPDGPLASGPGTGDARQPNAGAGDARQLDAMSRSSIESRLKSMYDEVASEPVPDRFLQLLDKLERSEGGEAGR